MVGRLMHRGSTGRGAQRATVQGAIDEALLVPLLNEACYARFALRRGADYAHRVPPATRREFSGNGEQRAPVDGT